MSTSIRSDKDAAAQGLASAHYDVDPSVERIVRLLDPDPEKERQNDEPIKLLEVNADTIKTGIQPVYFGPDAARGMPFPSIIIEIHPDEYQALAGDDSSLRPWKRGEEYPRVNGA